MAEVTNDLIYEVLKRVQEDVSLARSEIKGVREEVTAIRGTCSPFGALETRVDDRISRLELSDVHT